MFLEKYPMDNQTCNLIIGSCESAGAVMCGWVGPWGGGVWYWDRRVGLQGMAGCGAGATADFEYLRRWLAKAGSEENGCVWLWYVGREHSGEVVPRCMNFFVPELLSQI